MIIEHYRQLWGFESPLSSGLPLIKSQGYAGVEIYLPIIKEQQVAAMIADNGLKSIYQIITEGMSVDEHVDSFERQLEASQPFHPAKINVHAGRDAFSETEAVAFLERVLELSRAIDVPVIFETHRGRIFYNPWTTFRMLQLLPELQLCCDYSHWICVCERMLTDMPAILELCANRCTHIHTRVGHPEGPQVAHPAAPECAELWAHHLVLWKQIVAAQKASGATLLTLTPEFGPQPYLPTLPFTGAPLVNLEEVVEWVDKQVAHELGPFR
jgi:sugar phosphate isomerase/epimerase